MKLDPTHRQIIDDILAEATASNTRTAEQIGEALRQLDDLEGSGVEWVSDFTDNLRRQGMAKELAAYRRRQRSAAKTEKGTEVEAPNFGGVRRPTEDGSEEYHQLSFSDMTADDLRGWITDRRKARDTVSREIQWATDVLDIMTEQGHALAGPAIDELARRHA